jgi:hypothetical protein
VYPGSEALTLFVETFHHLGDHLGFVGAQIHLFVPAPTSALRPGDEVPVEILVRRDRATLRFTGTVAALRGAGGNRGLLILPDERAVESLMLWSRGEARLGAREHERFPCQFRVACLGPRRPVPGEILNISFGGAFVAAERRQDLATGSAIELRLLGREASETGLVKLNATIARIGPPPSDGFGVKFRTEDEDQRAARQLVGLARARLGLKDEGGGGSGNA